PIRRRRSSTSGACPFPAPAPFDHRPRERAPAVTMTRRPSPTRVSNPSSTDRMTGARPAASATAEARRLPSAWSTIANAMISALAAPSSALNRKSGDVRGRSRERVALAEAAFVPGPMLASRFSFDRLVTGDASARGAIDLLPRMRPMARETVFVSGGRVKGRTAHGMAGRARVGRHLRSAGAMTDGAVVAKDMAAGVLMASGARRGRERAIVVARPAPDRDVGWIREGMERRCVRADGDERARRGIAVEEVMTEGAIARNRLPRFGDHVAVVAAEAAGKALVARVIRVGSPVDRIRREMVARP